MKRYATGKQMKSLEDAVTKLAKSVLNLCEWQTYHILERNPYVITEPMRKQILGGIKEEPLLLYLYQRLFKEHPPISSHSQLVHNAIPERKVT